MNADRLLEVYEQISEAPDAIARLRRFVLDLAVRGKLVEQDAGDEPAPHLVERIAAGKSRLVKAGKIRKSRKESELSEESPYELPAKWTWIPFGEIHHLVRGVTYAKADVSDSASKGFVPILRANNIASILTHDNPVYVKSERVSPDQYLRKGDYMIALSSGSKNLVGKAALVSDDLDEAFGGFCGAIRLFEPSLVGFVGVFLRSNLYRESISAGSRGIGINNLKKEVLANLYFPLPPLAEQHRIVAKVDELMALCDRLEEARKTREETRDKLTAASLARLTAPDTTAEDFPTHANFAVEALLALTTRPDQIKTLRQTILNLAVRGKLVEQDPADEPASALLESIGKERMARVGKGELRKAKGVAPPSLDAQLFQLPSKWEWSVADQIWDFENGDRSSNYPSRDQLVVTGIPFVNAGHLVTGRVSLAGMNYITPAKFASLGGGKLRQGDQIYCLRGSLGKHAVFDLDCAAAIASSLVILRPIIAECVPYLALYLDTDIAQTLLRRFDNGSAQPNLSSASLRKFEIPLPPLAEQHRIVAKVDALLALCDRLEAALTTTDTTRTRLLEAVLHEALEPSSPQDEIAA